MSPGRDLNAEARHGEGGWLIPLGDGLYQPLKDGDDLDDLWGLPHSPASRSATQMEMLDLLDGLGKIVLNI